MKEWHPCRQCGVLVLTTDYPCPGCGGDPCNPVISVQVIQIPPKTQWRIAMGLKYGPAALAMESIGEIKYPETR